MSVPKQVLRHRALLPLVLIVLAALFGSSAAQADGPPRPRLQMPVPCGQTWAASTYTDNPDTPQADGHWPDEDSIDLAQRDGEWDNISEDEPVLASADGTVMNVFTTSSGENRIYLDHGDWATFYIHLEDDPDQPLEVGDFVAQGERIGTTGATGIADPTQNDMHIHYTQAIIDGIDNAERIEFDRVPIDTREADPDTWGTYNSEDAEQLTSVNCAGNSFMGFTQNAMRYQLVYNPSTGAVKIVRLDADGTGATTTMTTTWTRGWTHFMPFIAPSGAQHYFQYKASSGRVRFAQIAGGGSGTTELSESEWGEDWTHFVPLSLDGDPYFVAYDSLHGAAKILEINAEGSDAETAYSATWDRGWAHIVPFESGPDQFILLYKGSGEVEIDRVTETGGDIDLEETWSGQWKKGWTNLVPVNHNGSRYVIAYNATSGAAAFVQLDHDGEGVEKLADRSWQRGWTALTPFSIGGDGHILLYKLATGDVKVVALNDEGDDVETIWTGGWQRGWS